MLRDDQFELVSIGELSKTGLRLRLDSVSVGEEE